MHLMKTNKSRTEESERVGASWPSSASPTTVNDGVCTVDFSPILLRSPAPVMRFMQRILYQRQDSASPGQLEVVVERTLWSKAFDSDQAATAYSNWMNSKAESWAYFGQFCLAFGSDTLTAVIDVELAELRNQELEKEEKVRRKADRQRELAKVIDSYIIERKGQFGITLQRGNADKAFFEMFFRERWEREGFRDWFRHQHRQFAHYAELLASGSSVELERYLLAEMLRVEGEVKKSGLSAGGRRPLRFYRGEE